jgi:hypothetical protein
MLLYIGIELRIQVAKHGTLEKESCELAESVAIG